jgi:hypothetical protein
VHVNRHTVRNNSSLSVDRRVVPRWPDPSSHPSPRRSGSLCRRLPTSRPLSAQPALKLLASRKHGPQTHHPMFSSASVICSLPPPIHPCSSAAAALGRPIAAADGAERADAATTTSTGHTTAAAQAAHWTAAAQGPQTKCLARAARGGHAQVVCVGNGVVVMTVRTSHATRTHRRPSRPSPR